MEFFKAFYEKWIKALFGNAAKIVLGILIFVLVFLFLAVRCQSAHAGELHLETGAQIITGTGPFIGLYYKWSDISNHVSFEVGTQMLGKTEKTENNWAPFGMLQVTKSTFSAGIGFAYLQNVDALDGSHLNYTLNLKWQAKPRVGLTVRHDSNAGTTPRNVGRNMVALDWRLQ